MFWAFIVALLVSALMGAFRLEASLFVLLGGAAAIHGMGLADDFKNLRAYFKFGVQLAVAIAVAAAGYRFEYLPGSGSGIPLGVFSWIITIVWIVGLSNAINMIDGMDGLAGGISLIAALSFGGLSLALGQAEGAIVAFALAGAIVGFLFFNFPPARIFMGDSGSLFLGYCLAILPLLGTGAFPSEFSFLASGTVVAIPVLDVFAAILRRRRRGQGVMTPDREHLHHKLMDLGLDARQILAIVYASAIGLGVAGMLATVLLPGASLIALLAALAMAVSAFVWLHYAKKALVR
ncbi:MAG: MraY family glycosyltransferase [Rectinemataceae bacterium]